MNEEPLGETRLYKFVEQALQGAGLGCFLFCVLISLYILIKDAAVVI